MQKIYAFRVSLMNGTVTANTHVEACASRELAEQVKEAVRLANVNNDTLGGLTLHFSDIEELTLWESADEVPVLNPKPKTREQLEQERGQVLHDLTYARECMKKLTRNDHTREWMSKMTARQEERLKEIEDELAALDGSPAPPADIDKSIVIEYPVPTEQDEVDFLKGLVRKHKDSVWPARAMHKEWTGKYGHRYGKAVQAMDVHVAPLDGGRTRVSFLVPFWDTKVEDGV